MAQNWVRGGGVKKYGQNSVWLEQPFPIPLLKVPRRRYNRGMEGVFSLKKKDKILPVSVSVGGVCR